MTFINLLILFLKGFLYFLEGIINGSWFFHKIFITNLLTFFFLIKGRLKIKKKKEFHLKMESPWIFFYHFFFLLSYIFIFILGIFFLRWSNLFKQVDLNPTVMEFINFFYQESFFLLIFHFYFFLLIFYSFYKFISFMNEKMKNIFLRIYIYLYKIKNFQSFCEKGKRISFYRFLSWLQSMVFHFFFKKKNAEFQDRFQKILFYFFYLLPFLLFFFLFFFDVFLNHLIITKIYFFLPFFLCYQIWVKSSIFLQSKIFLLDEDLFYIYYPQDGIMDSDENHAVFVAFPNGKRVYIYDAKMNLYMSYLNKKCIKDDFILWKGTGSDKELNFYFSDFVSQK